MDDVNNEDTNPQTGDPSTSGGQQTPQSVPYDRFQEVVKDKNTYLKDKETLESDNENLKSKIGELEKKSNLSDDDKKELKDNKDISKVIEETIEKREKDKINSEKREQEKFEKDVDKGIDTFPDVDRSKFLEFMEKEAGEYGISSVEGGMKLYRNLNNLTKETKEKALNEIKSKPNMPRSEGEGGQTAQRPEADKGKSLSQIAEEVVREQMNS